MIFSLKLTPTLCAVLGTGLCSVLPHGAGSSACVLHLCDGPSRMGLPGAPHGDGVLLLLRHGALEDRYSIAHQPTALSQLYTMEHMLYIHTDIVTLLE